MRGPGVGRTGPGRRTVGTAALCGCLAALSACGLRTPPFQTPPSAAVPELRERWLSDRGDVRAALGLAAAQIEAGAGDDARMVLASTHEIMPAAPLVTVVLGMAEHRMGRPLEADRLYEAFMEADPTSPFMPEVLMRRYAMRAHVTDAWAAGRVDATVQLPRGEGSMVAILPFAHDPGDEDAAALSAGLAELLAGDLGRAGHAVVDPAEIRALLRALEVPADRLRSLGTARRMGTLAGATAVVHGALVPDPDGDVRIEAVMWAAEGEAHVVTDLTVDRVPGDLVAIQKRLASLVLVSRIGAVAPRDARVLAVRELTGADAVSAYGRGLLLTDAADHASAAEAYALAASLDPMSSLATREAERARVAAALEAEPLGQAIVRAVRIGEVRRAMASQSSRPGPVTETEGLGQGARSTMSEVLGTDVLGAARLFGISFTVPGGGR